MYSTGIMREFQQKRRWRQIISSNIVLALLAAVVVWLSAHTVGIWRQREAVRREAERLEEQVQKIRAEREQLQAQLSEINDPEVLEYEARSRLNIKKPGEEVLIIVEDEVQNKQVDQDSERGFFDTLLRFLKLK